MPCRGCGSSLRRPGDYCLVCRTRNADAVVLELDRDRATVTTLDKTDIVGRRIVTTTPASPDDEHVRTELRNFAGLIADEVRRKRPDAVYASGDRDVLRSVRSQLHYELYRVPGPDPVDEVLTRRNETPLEVVDAPTAEKLGGAHSTVIGDRAGRRALATVASHPHVKKIVPGPIDASGSSSHRGLGAKATRADERGNVRLLLRDGSSVQEVQVVTTAGDRRLGEEVRADLNDALTDADLAN